MRRIAVITIVVFCAGVVAAAVFGYWPGLVVGRAVVSYRSVKFNESLAASYYANVGNSYNILRGKGRDEVAIDRDELRKGVVNELIERVLIHEELTKELGDEVLEAMVRDRVERLREKALQEAASSLYGASGGAVERHVFAPQAERDILWGRMFLRGEHFTEWLQNAKQSAQIKIFFPGIEWNP